MPAGADARELALVVSSLTRANPGQSMSWREAPPRVMKIRYRELQLAAFRPRPRACPFRRRRRTCRGLKATIPIGLNYGIVQERRHIFLRKT